MEKSVKRGLLLVMSGPSGVGKGTVRDLLMKDKSLNLFYSVSMTTRYQRPGEVNGREYYFVSEDEFYKNVREGNLLEWAQYVGNCYGTPKDKVEEMLDEGKNVLLEIDVSGATSVIKKVRGAVSIFILPPSFDDLEKRIRSRGTETDEAIENRVNIARKELEYKNLYEYNVVNDNLEKCVAEITKIIKSLM